MAAYILGSASTEFRRHPERDFRSLAREVVEGALGDAGVEGSAPSSAWFGNCAMGTWGQANIRGQVAMTPMLRDVEIVGINRVGAMIRPQEVLDVLD